MALSDFIGMLKLTIRDNTTETPKFVVLGANQLGSDGLSISDSANEITIGTFAGDVTLPNGIATSAGTATVIPLKTADMGKLFPQGFDATTGTWQMPIGGCDALDADVVLEKVCDTKGGLIFRHAQISPAFETSRTRDDVFQVAIQFYQTPSLGSEYGLTGDNANKQFLRQMFDGTYDPTTGKVTFDPVA